MVARPNANPAVPTPTTPAASVPYAPPGADPRAMGPIPSNAIAAVEPPPAGLGAWLQSLVMDRSPGEASQARIINPGGPMHGQTIQPGDPARAGTNIVSAKQGKANQASAQAQLASQSQSQLPSDPNAMALQMFFSQVIAPYLNQLAGNLGNVGDQYAQATQGMQQHLAPDLQPFFNPAQKQAQVKSYANALAGSAVIAPELQKLLGGISAATEAQDFLARQMKNQQAQSQLGGFAELLAGGEEKK